MARALASCLPLEFTVLKVEANWHSRKASAQRPRRAHWVARPPKGRTSLLVQVPPPIAAKSALPLPRDFRHFHFCNKVPEQSVAGRERRLFEHL